MLSLSRDTRSSIGKLLHSSLKNRSIYIDSNGNSNATMQLRHDVSNKEGNDRDPKSYDPSLNDPSYLNKNHQSLNKAHVDRNFAHGPASAIKARTKENSSSTVQSQKRVTFSDTLTIEQMQGERVGVPRNIHRRKSTDLINETPHLMNESQRSIVSAQYFSNTH